MLIAQQGKLYIKINKNYSYFLGQDFDLQPDPLGNTQIEDLSKIDLDHLKSLTLIELTALFDNNNILWSRRKAKKKFKGIFKYLILHLPF